MTLSQTDAIRRLKNFNMELCKAVSTQMEKNVSALPRVDAELARDAPFRAMAGSLLYFAMCTRPDISYAVSAFAQYCKAPTTVYLTKTKRLFRYLKGTQHTGLVYTKSRSQDELGSFVGYADANWAGSPFRKSTSISALFYDNCSISWKSRKERIVALSTTDAQMIALVDTYKEHKSVHKLF